MFSSLVVQMFLVFGGTMELRPIAVSLVFNHELHCFRNEIARFPFSFFLHNITSIEFDCKQCVSLYIAYNHNTTPLCYFCVGALAGAGGVAICFASLDAITVDAISAAF